ncbi:glycine--tRNA ligase subunit beta [Neptunicella marina]|uniref:Glycine--tRNA ligase beta subunit n=1 Tax=Neptunicella marina TaxID=2125989 RepID=A0A8J6IWH7_9ALTE|nr:glycine--tRNA ligase subunit beta [Neptunicella marina]MBC3766633.1 glycine--tRNA ligase subunit beta [Neptunicella marina]
MQQQQTLLFEIGTEELPPKALTTLASALALNIETGLNSLELAFDSVRWFATPRRLAVEVKNLQAQQHDKVVEKRGPAVSAAFDDNGQPTKAAMGWARGNGIDVSEAERLTTDKGEWLLYNAKVAGSHISDLVEELIRTSLSKLPIPKPMRWGNSKHQFIRPVHTVTILYGESLLDAEVLGIKSSRLIQGHRFHGKTNFELDHADNYLVQLENHFVLADFASRKQKIEQGILQAAEQEGATVDIDAELLDEVTALVEWPVILTASFEESFLQVPKEALIYTMKGDQKYFPVIDTQGKLLPRFIFVTNIESHDPEQVIKGNEKVIRPRLADAEFFYQTDKKKTLESRLESLNSVMFQQKLGTLADKSQRIADIAADIAEKIGADKTKAARAGLLSKTDLMTEMVMEFPDVQGVMGMYYAHNDGEDSEVALALNEQYMPRFAGDQLPTSMVSNAVALADKLDTLVGIFGIGMLPKGDKDPFALRRAAIGLLRIIMDNNLQLDLVELIAIAKQQLGDKLTNQSVESDVLEFLLGRFRAIYQEQGISVDVIHAVLATQPTKPADFDARVKGVSHFYTLESAQSLAAANKRVGNILAKNSVDSNAEVDSALLTDKAEQELYAQLEKSKQNNLDKLANADYQAVLTELAALRPAIDNFFDNVMVMCEDKAQQANRLALLNNLHQQFLNVADIALLQQA